MNKIFKVIYSKTRHCYVVVSELAKSHVKSSHGNSGQQKAALTMSVLLALGAFTFAFGPANAEAADENHYTEGQQDIGVYHTSNDTANAENHQGGLVSKNQGALGVGAISIGVHAEAGTGTITIGNRLAPSAQDSVFIGSKYDAENKVYKTASSKVVSIGADSNASGTGSVALGYGAEADVSNVSGKEKNPDKESQSIAIGYKATAKQNNIAIGANSVATDAASKETAKFRDNTDSDYNAPSSYVSVGSSTLKRRITNVAAGADENDVATVGQLKKVADNKIAWKLTTAGDSNNASTVSAGDTVDFSAAKDSKENGQVTGKDHSNLTISKEKENGTNKVNMTVGLSDNVVLGQNVSRKGGSLDVYRAVGDASSDTETNENNQSYDQLGSHVRIDGSTVSVHYDNGTDSDARGAVLGIANDSYQDTNDATKTVSSPLGYVYLQDGRNYYYLHGAMHGDTKYQGRLAYDSSESGYNYIANLDDGIKFSGDTKKDEKAVTVDTKLDSNAANNTLSITGGADVSDTTKLTNGNIGVVATTNETDSTTGEVKKAGGLSIQLAKNLTGITSISNQPTSATTTGAKLELGTNGTTISGGDVNVSKNKITGLKDGTDVTDAATVGQMNTAIGNAKTKYYSVTNSFKLGDYRTNENNDGATDDALAGMAAGYETGTTGIASTVAGSYSGVIGSGLQGAAAVSVGTVNVNNNTGTSKAFSGVANSIVGQANMTTDSNAAIIVGAGNSVTNSYRDLYTEDALSKITNAVASKDANALKEALRDAVPKSGAQVMVMGGGNNVESAYMSQVVGVGNTVTGADSTYAEGTSTQYNFVDGFQNELTNGKHDYIIGSNNKVNGNSINKNQSNIVFGDNHKLTDQKNNVIIGSSDTTNDETTASDVVAIGHNAKVSAEGGVAIGSGSKVAAASTEKVSGYDPTTKTQSADKTSHAWNATTGAVSIGTSDGTVTRQINGVAAGTNDTDAVNVAQLKKLEGMKANVDATNIQGENLTKWQTALGTGTVTSGNTGLMTGGAVYNEVRPTTDGTYVKSTSTTAANLSALDTQVNTNTGDITTNKTDIKNLKDLSNLTDAGKSVIKEAAKGSVKVVNGKNTIVTEGTEGDAKTYAVNVDNSTIKGAVQGDLDKKANVDATNIQGENLTKWQAALGTGAVTSGNTGLMTGGAVYNEVRPTKDGTYVKSTNTTAANLTALDTQVTTNTSDIAKNKTDIANNKTAIDNITKNVSDLSGNAVQYDADFNKQKVTLKGEGGTTIANVKDGALSDKSTDAVNGKQLFNEQQAREAADKAINDKIGTLNQNGKYILKDSSISSNLSTLDNKVKENADHIAQNTNDIKNLKDSSSTISKEIEIKAGKDLDNITDKGKQVIKDTMKADMDKKANVDASNIETSKWADKLGTGKVVEGDKNLINGDTVHNAIHEAEGRNPVQSDGQTITIGSKDTATKIDVSGTGKDGQSTGRIITGVVTDVDDPNSAANVGYVNSLTAANTQQIYRDMNNAYSRLDTNINRAAAGSNALAALHPLDFDPADKASFAVGYGHYRNANAAAVGAFYQPNANTMVNMGISLGNGDPGFNAGVSFKIGKGSAYNGVSKAEMAQTIHDQATEISAIKADDAAKDKRIDALEKENQEMKKQIQEILARLNG